MEGLSNWLTRSKPAKEPAGRRVHEPAQQPAE
jgi:hypothetical protein